MAKSKSVLQVIKDNARKRKVAWTIAINSIPAEEWVADKATALKSAQEVQQELCEEESLMTLEAALEELGLEVQE
jgi:hypothetical protein